MFFYIYFLIIFRVQIFIVGFFGIVKCGKYKQENVYRCMSFVIANLRIFFFLFTDENFFSVKFSSQPT